MTDHEKIKQMALDWHQGLGGNVDNLTEDEVSNIILEYKEWCAPLVMIREFVMNGGLKKS